MTIRLSTDELRFFRDNGFLIKRQVLNPELMAKAQDVFWANAPSQLQRDDPETWFGPFDEKHNLDDGENYRGNYRWNFRSIGRESWMMKLVPLDPNLHAMAEQMLGEGMLSPPERTRGIYTTLPRREPPANHDHLHVDEHAFHLGVVAYLGDVTPNAGGFRVWPSSHRWFYPSFESQYRPGRTEAYHAIRALFETQPSLECTGAAGDVVFWHHRLAHMAGRNHARSLRQAILFDYKRSDLDQTQEEPPQANMWRDWPGLDALPD